MKLIFSSQGRKFEHALTPLLWASHVPTAGLWVTACPWRGKGHPDPGCSSQRGATREGIPLQQLCPARWKAETKLSSFVSEMAHSSHCPGGTQGSAGVQRPQGTHGRATAPLLCAWRASACVPPQCRSPARHVCFSCSPFPVAHFSAVASVSIVLCLLISLITLIIDIVLCKSSRIPTLPSTARTWSVIFAPLK